MAFSRLPENFEQALSEVKADRFKIMQLESALAAEQEARARLEYLFDTISDVLYGGESAWRNIDFKEFGTHIRNSITDKNKYKQRAEAAEALIKASMEQEPWMRISHSQYGIAAEFIKGCNGNSYPHGMLLYAQPPIPPDVAELQQDNLSLVNSLELECVRSAELQRQLEEARKVPEGWKLVPIDPTDLMYLEGENLMDTTPRTIYKAMVSAAPQPKE